MQHPRPLVTAALLAAMITACGGSDSSYGNTPSTAPTNPGGTPGGTPVSTSNSVVIANDAFSPGTLEVPVGTTVTWQWKSCDDTGYGGYGTCVSHNVTFDDGSGIASSTQSTGTFSRAFTAAGTYKYHCVIHGASMSGVVTVK